METANRTPPGSSPFAWIALLTANLMPLAGVVLADWDLRSVLFFYWAESGIIGFFAVLRIVVFARQRSVFVAAFLCVHFSGFMAAHLVFLNLLTRPGGFMSAGAGGPLPDFAALAARTGWMGPVSLVGFLGSHALSFVLNAPAESERATMSPMTEMTRPYRRIVVMHVALVLGAGLVMAFGDPIVLLALLVILKTLLDARAHRKEHGGDAVPTTGG